MSGEYSYVLHYYRIGTLNAQERIAEGNQFFIKLSIGTFYAVYKNCGEKYSITT